MLKHATLPALLVLAASAHAADPKTEIGKLYQAYVVAVKAKKFNAIEGMLTPNFTVENQGQTFQRTQAIQMMKQALGEAKIDELKSKITAFTLKGNAATVNTEETMKLQLKNAANGKLSKVVVISTSKDSWVKVKDKWLLQKSTAIANKTYVDGQLQKS